MCWTPTATCWATQLSFRPRVNTLNHTRFRTRRREASEGQEKIRKLSAFFAPPHLRKRKDLKNLLNTVSTVSRWLAVFALAGSFLMGPQPGPGPGAKPYFTENFDGAFANDTNRYCENGGCDVPQGWGVWFIPHRDTDPAGINFQPKYASTTAPNRAKSGNAQRIFEQNKTFTAGIYRKVENVQVGAKLKFSVFGQVWSTNDESPISARPSSGIRLKVGIDPLGGNNGEISPLSSQVIWSGEQEAKDGFVEFTVETEARSSPRSSSTPMPP